MHTQNKPFLYTRFPAGIPDRESLYMLFYRKHFDNLFIIKTDPWTHFYCHIRIVRQQICRLNFKGCTRFYISQCFLTIHPVYHISRRTLYSVLISFCRKRCTEHLFFITVIRPLISYNQSLFVTIIFPFLCRDNFNVTIDPPPQTSWNRIFSILANNSTPHYALNDSTEQHYL